jgi:hypothetical protein
MGLNHLNCNNIMPEFQLFDNQLIVVISTEWGCNKNGHCSFGYELMGVILARRTIHPAQ